MNQHHSTDTFVKQTQLVSMLLAFALLILVVSACDTSFDHSSSNSQTTLTTAMGLVKQVTPNQLVLSQQEKVIPIQLNSKTRYEASDGTPTPFSSIVIGQNVEIFYRTRSGEQQIVAVQVRALPFSPSPSISNPPHQHW